MLDTHLPFFRIIHGHGVYLGLRRDVNHSGTIQLFRNKTRALHRKSSNYTIVLKPYVLPQINHLLTRNYPQLTNLHGWLLGPYHLSAALLQNPVEGILQQINVQLCLHKVVLNKHGKL